MKRLLPVFRALTGKGGGRRDASDERKGGRRRSRGTVDLDYGIQEAELIWRVIDLI